MCPEGPGSMSIAWTWPRAVAPAVRYQCSPVARDTQLWKCSAALIKLHKTLSKVVAPFPGQPCSRLLPAAAPQRLDWTSQVWRWLRGKPRRDGPTTGVWVGGFSSPLFHLWLPGKPPASRPQRAERGYSILHSRAGECQQFQPQGTETRGQLGKLFDMGQW